MRSIGGWLAGSCAAVSTASCSPSAAVRSHFSLHPTLPFLACANHGLVPGDTSGAISGSTALISLDENTGNVVALVDWIPHLDETDPRVLADPRRNVQNYNSHAHSANWSPTGRFLFVCEKGLDKVIVYEFVPPPPVAASSRSGGCLRAHSEAAVTPGGGARHLCIHPSGQVVYVNEESGGLIHVGNSPPFFIHGLYFLLLLLR